jgi:hypothetical protein
MPEQGLAVPVKEETKHCLRVKVNGCSIFESEHTHVLLVL